MVATVDPQESSAGGHASDVKRFFATFFRARGATEILIVSTLLSLGIGCIISLIPISVADRYARIHHDYDGDFCGSFDRQHKPEECQLGSDEAQSAAAWSNCGVSLLSLLFSPVLGSISDKRGRKPVLLLGLAGNTVPSAAFFMMLQAPKFNPSWYYTANCLTGVVQYLSIVFAILSDVIPDEFRAQGYGIVLAAFYAGLALSASMPLFWGSNAVALISFLLLSTSFAVAALILPETLVREEALEEDENQLEETIVAVDDNSTADDASAPAGAHRVSLGRSIYDALMRPFHEAAILNYNWLMRLVTASAFLSSMVTAADTTLVIYYVEEQLNVRVDDFAGMFLVLGLAGFVVQGGLIQPAVRLLGEKTLLLTTFLCGVLHNSIYGFARGKHAIYAALILAQWTRVNAPILSSLASKGATANEQGRIQGALFATNAIAYAVGPLSMEFIYSRTQNNAHLGPSFMFFYAAGIYLVGSVLVLLMPAPGTPDAEEAASTTVVTSADEQRSSGLDEPLLPSEPSQDLEEPLLEQNS